MGSRLRMLMVAVVAAGVLLRLAVHARYRLRSGNMFGSLVLMGEALYLMAAGLTVVAAVHAVGMLSGPGRRG